MRVGGKDHHPAWVYRGGALQPPSIWLKSSLLQAEDLFVRVAVSQYLGRDLEVEHLLPVGGWRHDVVLDR
jgi:hypothetical protein